MVLDVDFMTLNISNLILFNYFLSLWWTCSGPIQKKKKKKKIIYFNLCNFVKTFLVVNKSLYQF
jgi:hypothetical protein